MDLALFMVGASVGLAAGLILKHNKIQIIGTYYDSDMGKLGKKYYYDQ
jgi:hypothetical protein